MRLGNVLKVMGYMRKQIRVAGNRKYVFVKVDMGDVQEITGDKPGL